MSNAELADRLETAVRYYYSYEPDSEIPNLIIKHEAQILAALRQPESDSENPLTKETK